MVPPKNSHFNPISWSTLYFLQIVLILFGGKKTCHAASTQNANSVLHLDMPKSGMITNQASSKCPAVARSKKKDKTKIIQWKCSDTRRNQQWSFVPVEQAGAVKNKKKDETTSGDGAQLFRIQVLHSRKCMGVKMNNNGKARAGALIKQFACDEDDKGRRGATTLFQIKPVNKNKKIDKGKGAHQEDITMIYNIVLASTGMCVQFRTHSNMKTISLALLEQRPCDPNNEGQKWKITAELPLFVTAAESNPTNITTSIVDAVLPMRNDLYWSHCATIKDAGTANGASLVMLKCIFPRAAAAGEMTSKGQLVLPLHQGFAFTHVSDFDLARPKWSDHFPSERKSYYTIKAQHSGKCLQPQDASDKTGAAIVQMDCSPGDPSQEWTVSVSYHDLSKTFQNRKSGLCISTSYSDSVAPKDLDGKILRQEPCDPCYPTKIRDAKMSLGGDVLPAGLLPERMFWEADGFPVEVHHEKEKDGRLKRSVYDFGCPVWDYPCCVC